MMRYSLATIVMALMMGQSAGAVENTPTQVQRFVDLGLVQGVVVEETTATVTVEPMFHDAEFGSKADVAAAIFQAYAGAGVDRLLLVAAGSSEPFAEYSATGLLIY